jgi:hypothetical protein
LAGGTVDRARKTFIVLQDGFFRATGYTLALKEELRRLTGGTALSRGTTKTLRVITGLTEGIFLKILGRTGRDTFFVKKKKIGLTGLALTVVETGLAVGRTG